MSEQKESSVLFSLKELMNLEEDRIKQEESARQRQVAAEAQARVDAERRARDEEDARIKAEDDRRRSEEQRAREEATRLEAIRHGEIEKARLDADNAARIEQMRHQQEHERHIKAIGQDAHKKRLTLMLSLAAAFLVIAVVGGGFYIKSQSDAADAQRIANQAALKEKQDQLDSLTKKLQDQMDEATKLQAEYANAKDDAARMAAQQKLAEAQKQAAETRRNISNVQSRPSTGGASKPKAPCNCPAGDPLCSCIP